MAGTSPAMTFAAYQLASLVLSTVPNTAGVAGYISPSDNASLNREFLRSFKNHARTDANRAVGTAGHGLPC
jgi:hypothetical protein